MILCDIIHLFIYLGELMCRFVAIADADALAQFVAKDAYVIVLYIQDGDFASNLMRGYLARMGRTYWFVDVGVVNVGEFDGDIPILLHTPTVVMYNKKRPVRTVVGTDYNAINAILRGVFLCGAIAANARTAYQRR